MQHQTSVWGEVMGSFSRQVPAGPSRVPAPPGGRRSEQFVFPDPTPVGLGAEALGSGPFSLTLPLLMLPKM